jgi:putative ABC transport system permease protein
MLTLLRRITRLLNASRVQRDLTEELEHHRAMRQEQLEIAGMAPDAAQYAARRALGNATLAREEARAVWLPPRLESVWQDVRYTVKTIRRGPAFAAAVVLILSIGIGATTCVFGLLDGLVLRTLPVREPARLVWFRDPSFSYPIFTELRARSGQLFSGLFAWDIERRNVEWSTGVEGTDVTLATGEYYSTLGVTAARGRTFDQRDDRPGGGPDGRVAVLSDAAWTRRFNRDPSVIGTRITIDRVPFTIIGVTPAGFFGVSPGLSPELTVPVTTITEPAALRVPTSAWLHLMARLTPGITIDRGNAALSTVWPAVLEATTLEGQPPERRARYLARRTSLEPGRAGYSRVRNQFVEPLRLLFALTGLLLAVACASVANLLLARADARRRELALRLAIGASRGRVVRQLLTEAAVWTALGATGGVLLASAASRALVTLLSTYEDPIVLDTSVGVRPMMFTLALSIVTATATALVPALRATRDPSPGLTARGGLAILRGWTMAKSFVSVQVALTVLLLAGAALFTRSLLLIVSQDTGFERNRIAIVTTDPVRDGWQRTTRTCSRRSAVFQASSRSPCPGCHRSATSLAIGRRASPWTARRCRSTDPAPCTSTPYRPATSIRCVFVCCVGAISPTRIVRPLPRWPSSTPRSLASTSVIPTRLAGGSASARARPGRISRSSASCRTSSTSASRKKPGASRSCRAPSSVSS